jgi:KipI family sensor histidine kinase inhibitor
MRVLPCGDVAILIELDDQDDQDDSDQNRERDQNQALGDHNQDRDREDGSARAPVPPFTAADLAAAVAAQPPTGLVDVVPAARTVLIRVARGTNLAETARHVLGLDPTRRPAIGADTDIDTDTHTDRAVAVPVTYDGPDLDRVAELTGLSVAEVIAAHMNAQWTVEFCGFAPGFAYLTSGDPRLVVPRRDRPRARVPRGSVALAGPYSAVYPGDSPGGWQLIGRTDAAVWDLDRDPPALLGPGTRVQFVPAVTAATE